MYSSKQPDSRFDNNTAEIFQQSSHVVQLPPYKPLKTKLINIDTRFQTNSFTTVSDAVFKMSLPQRITDVETLTVKTVELPMTFYNFSASLCNNFFSVLTSSGNVVHNITVADGNYSTADSLVLAVNNTLVSSDISCGIVYGGGGGTSEGKVTLTNHRSSSVVIAFDVDTAGNADKKEFKGKLGWALGFKLNRYVLDPNTTITAEGFINVNTLRYIYLALSENPGQGIPSSFVCPTFNYYLNKDILARVAVDYISFPFGSVIPANLHNGLLLSDTRKYTPGKVALQNLNIELVNEFGHPLCLNGHDFSFVLEVENY